MPAPRKPDQSAPAAVCRLGDRAGAFLDHGNRNARNDFRGLRSRLVVGSGQRCMPANRRGTVALRRRLVVGPVRQHLPAADGWTTPGMRQWLVVGPHHQKMPAAHEPVMNLLLRAQPQIAAVGVEKQVVVAEGPKAGVDEGAV